MMNIVLKEKFKVGREVKETYTRPYNIEPSLSSNLSFEDRTASILKKLRDEYKAGKTHTKIEYRTKELFSKKIKYRPLVIIFDVLLEVILTDGDKKKIIKIEDIIIPDNYKQVNVNVHYLNNTCDELVIYVDNNITLKELSEDTRLIRSYLCKSINNEVFDKPRYKAINMPKVTNIEFYE